jgi:hypothetical protein
MLLDWFDGHGRPDSGRGQRGRQQETGRLEENSKGHGISFEKSGWEDRRDGRGLEVGDQVGGDTHLFRCDEVTESWMEKEVQLQK